MKTASILLALAATLAPALAQSSKSSATTSPLTSTSSSSSSIQTSQSTSPIGSSSSVQSQKISSSSTSSTTPTTTSSSTTSAAPITVQSAGLFTYIGCYGDNVTSRALTGLTKPVAASQNDVETCASACSAYAYFGVEWSHVCLSRTQIASFYSSCEPRNTIRGL